MRWIRSAMKLPSAWFRVYSLALLICALACIRVLELAPRRLRRRHRESPHRRREPHHRGCPPARLDDPAQPLHHLPGRSRRNHQSLRLFPSRRQRPRPAHGQARRLDAAAPGRRRVGSRRPEDSGRTQRVARGDHPESDHLRRDRPRRCGPIAFTLNGLPSLSIGGARRFCRGLATRPAPARGRSPERHRSRPRRQCRRPCG